MQITKLFGHRMRQYRKSKNLSQEELAHLSQLHRTYIGAVERGERNITLINAQKIATALSEPLVSLLVESDNAN